MRIQHSNMSQWISEVIVVAIAGWRHNITTKEELSTTVMSEVMGDFKYLKNLAYIQIKTVKLNRGRNSYKKYDPSLSTMASICWK